MACGSSSAAEQPAPLLLQVAAAGLFAGCPSGGGLDPDYVCNGAVIVAEFGDKETDAEAVAALQRHFPDREIVALNIDPIGEVGGGIHCATQQMPA